MAKNERNVIGMELNLDITSLKLGLTEANKRISEADNEFKHITSTMENWQKTTDGVRAKVNQLNKTYELQNLKLRAIEEEIENVSKKDGDHTLVLEKLNKQLREQQIKVNRTKIELDNYSDTLEKAEKGEIDLEKATLKNGKAFQKAEKQITETKESTNKLGEGFTVLKGVMAGLIRDGINALVSGLKSSVAETRELRKEFGMLEATAKATGSSFEDAQDNLIKVASITDDTGAAVEGMNNLMSAGFDGDMLNKMTDQLLGASIKFKDTLKFEGLSDGLQETLATGKAVGPFSELLERSGVVLEDFDEGLKNANTDAEKQTYVLNQLSKLGLLDAKEAYEEVNGGMIDYNKAVLENQSAMSVIGKSLEPLTTKFIELKTKGIQAITPAIQNVSKALLDAFNGDMSGITNLITNIKTKISELLPQVIDYIITNLPVWFGFILEQLKERIQMILEILPDIINILVQILTAIIAELPNIVSQIAAALTEMLPILLDGAVTLFNALIDAIPIILDALIPILPTIIDTIINFFTENLPVILDGATKLLLAIVQAIPKILVPLAEAIPEIVKTVTRVLIDNLPVIFDAGIQIFTAIIEAIPEILPSLIGAIPQIVGAIWDTLMETDWLDLGLQIIKGILKGFSSAGDVIWSAVKDFGNTCVDKIKNFFKIKSPSRLMEKEVGLNLGLGVGNGLVDSVSKVKKDISTFNNNIFGELSSGQNVGGGIVNAAPSVNYTQIINTTKEPTIKELARYTNNLLDLNKVKGGLVS